MKRQLKVFKAPVKQQGAVLIVSLVILLILSFLAVQGTQTSTLEEKMAGNFRSKKVAFEAAEAALLAAEEWLEEQDTPPTASTDGLDGIFSLGAATVRDDIFWDVGDAGVHEVADASSLSLPTSPLFVIEERNQEVSEGGSAEHGAITKSNSQRVVFNYRITARGTGTTDNSVVLLQSHFKRTYD